jgi:hypothetical protein
LEKHHAYKYDLEDGDVTVVMAEMRHDDRLRLTATKAWMMRCLVVAKKWSFSPPIAWACTVANPSAFSFPPPLFPFPPSSPFLLQLNKRQGSYGVAPLL